jgi:hypothetical protein
MPQPCLAAGQGFLRSALDECHTRWSALPRFRIGCCAFLVSHIHIVNLIKNMSIPFT